MTTAADTASMMAAAADTASTAAFAADVRALALQTSVLGAWREATTATEPLKIESSECGAQWPGDERDEESACDDVFFWEAKMASCVHRSGAHPRTGSKYSARHVRQSNAIRTNARPRR
jgi:hypothetical protein